MKFIAIFILIWMMDEIHPFKTSVSSVTAFRRHRRLRRLCLSQHTEKEEEMEMEMEMEILGCATDASGGPSENPTHPERTTSCSKEAIAMALNTKTHTKLAPDCFLKIVQT
jgi:hypothetical protein